MALPVTTDELVDKASGAKRASVVLARASAAAKNQALAAVARAIRAREQEILAANARDALPNGGKVRIAARNVPEGAPLPLDVPAGCYVGFSVEDTGAGMAPAVLAKATEAFFTTKGRDRGTGLGLAMVKAFATEAGGALQIQSDPGHGTCVEILLPRAPARVQPLDARDARCALTEELKARMRSPWLREALQAWRDACGR